MPSAGAMAKMKDLGTLGGPDSQAIWINDAGDIAGSADLPTPGIHDAVIWRHGRIKDLGTLPGEPCSRGRAINSRGQVVGGSSDCANFLHAFVWEEGGPMRDLNKLIRPGLGPANNQCLQHQRPWRDSCEVVSDRHNAE